MWSRPFPGRQAPDPRFSVKPGLASNPRVVTGPSLPAVLHAGFPLSHAEGRTPRVSVQHGAILRAPGFCAGESGSYTCRKKAVSETPPAALGGANQCRTETCLSVTDTCLGDDSERCFCAQNACVACRDPQCSEHVLGVRGPSVDGGSRVSVPPRASEGGAAVSPASTPGPAPPSSSESPSSLLPGAPSGCRERLPTAHRRKPKSSHMCVSWAWTPLPGCLGLDVPGNPPCKGPL